MTHHPPANRMDLAARHPRSLLAHLVRVGEDTGFRPAVPAAPTQTEPGSPDKVEVLAARLLDGEDLWHRDDFVRRRP